MPEINPETSVTRTFGRVPELYEPLFAEIFALMNYMARQVCGQSVLRCAGDFMVHPDMSKTKFCTMSKASVGFRRARSKQIFIFK